MGPSRNDFRSLLIRYRDEDDDVAFAAFAHAMWACLCVRAFQVLWDRHLAEDAAQEALLRIARAVRGGRWRARCRVESWACTIVFRVAIDLLRRRRRVEFILNPESRPDGEASPLEILECRELHARIREWLRAHRESPEGRVLFWYYFEGMTLEGIGQRLRPRRGPPRVLTLRNRAVARLAAFLGVGRT
ncbi:MAG TPA: sigma-70 family RNA polymerase sigma factor [Gemmataceae bacterium]